MGPLQGCGPLSPTSTINFDPAWMHVAMRNVSNPSQSAWLNNTAAGISIVRPADNQYTVSVDIAAVTGGTVNFSDLTDVAFNLNMGSMTMSRSFRFTN